MQTQEQQTEPSYIFDGARLCYVPRGDIPDCFDEFAPFFEMILDREPHLTLGYIRDILCQGHAQLWVLTKDKPIGVMVTQVERYQSNVGLLWIAAGAGIQAGLEAYRAVIEPWFIDNGCTMIEIRGRKGWERVLPDYENQGIILRKSI